ncbi:porin [Shewanella intestini]|uniref:Porin n=1 Tax=Shewanella intestini TaxID=2017544 RepID=A0ABS5HZ33_9GAMM|nr:MULTISPECIES: porin [Shewanella]MBR9727044.1 porin [Shewanella intestini]MRG35845.1 porin [Shewanella sp. XMDDZSB0408]
MNFTLKALPLAISVAMLPISAQADEATDAKIAKLEQQVQSLQKQQTNSIADKFNFNGFINVAYISANNDAGYNNATTSADFNQDSKLGFQGTFNISNQTQAVMQLVTRGANDWDVEAEWAYISHRFDNGIQARAGRLRVPLFLYSDFLDVGYAQPFARPPVEVYESVPFSSYTGGDVSYDIEFDNSTLTLQGFGGESDVKDAERDVVLNNIMGANITWTDFTWTARAVYGQTSIDGEVYLNENPSTIQDRKSTFTGVSGSYDNGNFFATGEWTQVTIEGALADNESAYLTLGYRIGEFTPYVTAAYYETIDNDERANNPTYAFAFDRERTAYSAGLRWDFIDSVALKFDVTYLTDFNDTHGGLNGNIERALKGLEMHDSTAIYTVKIDAVF